jgi:DNA-binding NarL/FixJ family response regulator
MENEITILIADDHPIVRYGLRQTIEKASGLRVVAEVSDGHEALDAIQKYKPHVAILDIDMPGIDGFRITEILRELELEVKIIFLTIHREESFLNKALKVGARGYVLKESSLADIVVGIRKIVAGQTFISEGMASYLLKNAQELRPAKGLAVLTPSERTILRMLVEYKTNKEIAYALFISPRTVETHRANICQKLNLSGSHALMKFALAHRAEL